MDPETNGDDQEREILTQRANKVRSRLLADVDTLEARRQQLAGTLHTLQRNTKRLLPVVAVGAAGAAVVGVALWMLGRRRRRRRDIALLPWAHVDLAAEQVHSVKSPTRKLVENVAGTLALAFARRLATRAVVRWVENKAVSAAPPSAAE